MPNQAETVSINDAAAMLGISVTHARKLLRTGEFPIRVINMGGVSRVPRRPLEALLSADAVGVPARFMSLMRSRIAGFDEESGEALMEPLPLGQDGEAQVEITLRVAQKHLGALAVSSEFVRLSITKDRE